MERLEPPEEPLQPYLSNDGPRADDEALLVEGAEQASRLPDASPTEELANGDVPDYEPSEPGCKNFCGLTYAGMQPC